MHLVPAVLGVMTRGTVLAAALALAAGSFAVRASGGGVEPPAERPPPDGRLSIALAALAAIALALNVAAFLRTNANLPILHVDALSFHLPDVASWIQDHSIWSNNEFIPRFPTGTYPSNGDVMFLAAVLPFHNDAFVRLVDLPFLALTGVAVYALALELRAPRAVAILFAAALLSIRAVMSFAVDQIVPDVVLLATLAAGALFLVRHLRTSRTSDLVLGGVGLGIAFGTKWYGVSVVAAVLASWALVSLLARRGRGVVARQGLALLGLVAAFGGVWFVRNWVVTGNPLFPVKVQLAGVTIFDAPRNVLLERYGYSIFDRLGQWSVFRHSIVPDWRVALGAPAALIGALALAGLVVVARKRARDRLVSLRVGFLGLSTLLVAAVYIVTPATAQGFASGPFRGLTGGNSRYVVPAFVLGAPAAAWLTARLGRLRPLAEVAALLAVIDGLRVTFALSWSSLVAALGPLLLAALAVGAALWMMRRPGTASGRRMTAVAMAALALLGAAVAGQRFQRSFNDGRYQGHDATVDWLIAHAPSGRRIGLAGEPRASGGLPSPVLPAFGPRYRNHVTYVGHDLGGIMARSPDERDFLTALRHSRVDLLELGLGAAPEAVRLPGPPVPELQWALAAGYRPVAHSPVYVLLAAPGFRG
ncbi:MAG: hypothetical protein QOK25_744 [Thermoleophilaceae bacterium]|nr:hypothetical protein [Thermoleophilaceae bacterium]